MLENYIYKIDFYKNMFVQVINLDNSIERMEVCATLLSRNKINFTRLNATYGLTDVELAEVDDVGNVIDVIDMQKLKNKEIVLEKYSKYRLFDKRYPSIKYYYCLNPETTIVKKKSRKRHLTAGEFGCMLSHLRAIFNVANGDDEIGMIVEDDMVIADNFVEKYQKIMQFAPKNYGILKLDGTSVRDLFKGNNHSSSFLFSAIKYGYNKYFYNAKAELLHGVSGATGYIITKSCAKKITELLKIETINGLEGAMDILLYITLPKKYNFSNIWLIKKPLIWQSGDESNITKLGR